MIKANALCGNLKQVISIIIDFVDFSNYKITKLFTFKLISQQKAYIGAARLDSLDDIYLVRNLAVDANNA